MATWREIVGWPYSVSSGGQIARHGGGLKKAAPNAKGYLHVQLWRDNTYKNFYVHKLVAEAFIGPCPEGYEVNHKDGDKSNCADWNLEYMTPSQNNIHALATGLRAKTAVKALCPKGHVKDLICLRRVNKSDGTVSVIMKCGVCHRARTRKQKA